MTKIYYLGIHSPSLVVWYIWLYTKYNTYVLVCWTVTFMIAIEHFCDSVCPFRLAPRQRKLAAFNVEQISWEPSSWAFQSRTPWLYFVWMTCSWKLSTSKMVRMKVFDFSYGFLSRIACHRLASTVDVHDGRFPVSAGFVTVSNHDALSSSEAGVNPRIRSWKCTCLIELDVRNPLVVSISQRSEELRPYNLV